MKADSAAVAGKKVRWVSANRRKSKALSRFFRKVDLLNVNSSVLLFCSLSAGGGEKRGRSKRRQQQSRETMASISSRVSSLLVKGGKSGSAAASSSLCPSSVGFSCNLDRPSFLGKQLRSSAIRCPAPSSSRSFQTEINLFMKPGMPHLTQNSATTIVFFAFSAILLFSHVFCVIINDFALW